MKRAGEFLGKVLGKLDRPEAGLAWLSSTWPSIVGKALAAHTRPLRCGGHCLVVSAEGEAWQLELENLKRELCDRINQAWGGSLVREVKFVAQTRASCAPHGLGGPGPISHEMDNQHIPFIRRRRA
jgi:predicted nucleic acid-binding Zn ribbon protein